MVEQTRIIVSTKPYKRELRERAKEGGVFIMEQGNQNEHVVGNDGDASDEKKKGDDA